MSHISLILSLFRSYASRARFYRVTYQHAAGVDMQFKAGTPQMKLHYSTDDPRLTLSFDGLEHHFELDVDMGGGDATDYNILEPSPTALRIDNEPADMQRFAAVV